MIWSATDLSKALNIEINPEILGANLQFNSKAVEKGDLFIALKGNGDGHDYATHAYARGASAVIVSKKVDNIPDDRVIMVEDTLTALHQMAEYKRKKSQAKFIGITGSVGKTSTKEALHIILSGFGKTFASRANFNNHLGVPLNLASMPDDIEYAIIEMGMNHAGEIKALAKIVKPDIAIVTWISEAHLEFFNSVEEIADAKSEIFEYLPENGIAVINSENQYYNRVLDNLRKAKIKPENIYTFGKLCLAHSKLKSYEHIGSNVRVVYEVNSYIIDVTLPFLAEHYVKNFASCLMVASILGLNLDKAAERLDKIELIDGRGKIIDLIIDGKRIKIICDYYNANPASMRASLEYFRQLSHPKKVAIIGDMPELGPTSAQLHIELVPFIIATGASKVFLVGKEARHISDHLPQTMVTRYFENTDAIVSAISNLINDGEVVLIKGARRLKLEKIVEFLQVENAV